MFTKKGKYTLFLCIFSLTLLVMPVILANDCVSNCSDDGEPAWTSFGACSVSYSAPNDCFATDGVNAHAWHWTSSSNTITCNGTSYPKCGKSDQDNACCPTGTPQCSGSPNNPSLLEPASGSIIASTSVTLSWSAVSGWGTNCDAGSYKIYVSTNADPFTNPMSGFPIDRGSGTSHDFTGGVRGTTYYWGVKSVNSIGNEGTSSIWSFTVNAFPTSAITIPSGNDKLCTGTSYDFSSTASDSNSNLTQVYTYRRQRNVGNTDWAAGSSWSTISSNAACGGTVGTCTTTTSGPWTPAGSDIGIWRIVTNAHDTMDNASDPGDKGRCSGNQDPPPNDWRDCGSNDSYDYTIGTRAAPVAPTLVSPANGSHTVSLRPTLTWSGNGFGYKCDSAETDKYYLELQPESGFVSKSDVGLSTSYTPPANLEMNTTYAWWACANNSDQETCTPTPYFFTTCQSGYPDAPALSSSIVDRVATLSWAPVPFNFNNTCANPRQFDVYIDTANPPTTLYGTYGEGTSSINFTGTMGTIYYWNVVARNGVFSSTAHVGIFTIPYKVTGLLWKEDTASNDCTASHSSRKIKNSDINTSIGIIPYVSGSQYPAPGKVNGSWDETNGYVIHGALGGQQSLCASIPTKNVNFRYLLSCLGTDTTGDLGGSCTSVALSQATSHCVNSSDDVRCDLGYKLTSNGWYSSIDGDAYGYTVSVGVPPDSEIQSGFENYLGLGASTIFSTKDISVVTSETPTKDRISKSGLYVKYASPNVDFTNSWLNNFSFNPPAGAVRLPLRLPGQSQQCKDVFTDGRLDPTKAYQIDASGGSTSCLQTAIDEMSGQKYKLGSSGVVVIYITGSSSSSDEIVFGSDDTVFQANNQNSERILFVSQVPIKISKKLGTADAVTFSVTTRPEIEAAFVSKSAITFEGTTDFLAQPDISTIVEGPLVSSETVVLNRDRGITNNFPAELVEFNPIYLFKLTSQEFNSDTSNYTGLVVPGVDWLP